MAYNLVTPSPPSRKSWSNWMRGHTYVAFIVHTKRAVIVKNYPTRYFLAGWIPVYMRYKQIFNGWHLKKKKCCKMQSQRSTQSCETVIRDPYHYILSRRYKIRWCPRMCCWATSIIKTTWTWLGTTQTIIEELLPPYPIKISLTSCTVTIILHTNHQINVSITPCCQRYRWSHRYHLLIQIWPPLIMLITLKIIIMQIMASSNRSNNHWRCVLTSRRIIIIVFTVWMP